MPGGRPTLFLVVGLPGAGKTTAAARLAADRGALRLTPDEWMIPLFAASDPDGKRDVLEGRLVATAFQVLALGVDVVLDFGFWSRAERASLRSLASSSGAACEVVYLPVDRATQLERVRQRWDEAPHTTYAMTEAEVDGWREQLEVPGTAELAGGAIPDPPAPWTTWVSWVADRWPSSIAD